MNRASTSEVVLELRWNQRRQAIAAGQRCQAWT